MPDESVSGSEPRALVRCDGDAAKPPSEPAVDGELLVAGDPRAASRAGEPASRGRDEGTGWRETSVGAAFLG
jgi:hypothetical protein